MIHLTILGEPASKANARSLFYPGGDTSKKPMFVKSKKAQTYLKALKAQVKPISPLLEGDLSFTARIHYASRRPDLDESLILDALQNLIYKNDRQIKEKHIYHDLDKLNPRAEIWIEVLK